MARSTPSTPSSVCKPTFEEGGVGGWGGDMSEIDSCVVGGADDDAGGVVGEGYADTGSKRGGEVGRRGS